MAKRDYILRYLFIIRILRKQKEASFEEIKQFIELEFELVGEVKTLSKRTFQRDKNEIRTIFNIEIDCNSLGSYFIRDDELSDFNNRILEGFDLFSSLSKFQRKSPFILLEERHPLGTEHIYAVLHAVQNCVMLNFTHQKYWDTTITQRTVEPYALKESQGRWYVLAKDRGDNRIKTFGLDRISNLEITSKKFSIPKGFVPESYFDDSFGVNTDSTIPVEDIVLSFGPLKAKYIKSFPLHKSQKEIEPLSSEYTISLRLRPTHDFIMEILSHGSEVRVIQPGSLQKQIKSKLEGVLKKYEV